MFRCEGKLKWTNAGENLRSCCAYVPVNLHLQSSDHQTRVSRLGWVRVEGRHGRRRAQRAEKREEEEARMIPGLRHCTTCAYEHHRGTIFGVLTNG